MNFIRKTAPDNENATPRKDRMTRPGVTCVIRLILTSAASQAGGKR